MGKNRPNSAQKHGPTFKAWRPSFHRCRHLRRSNGTALAGPSGPVWTLENRLQPVQTMGVKRSLGPTIFDGFAQARVDSLDFRFYYYSRSPRRKRRSWRRKKNAIGRSLKGFSSKIHSVVDSRGRAIFHSISPGQEPDCIRAMELIPHARGKVVIADKGYDSTKVARAIEGLGMRAMIPCRSTRMFPRKIDYRVYRRRMTVERSFHRIKRFRALATRYCKTAICFLSLVQLVSVVIWWL